MVLVVLDTSGRLTYLEAVPPQLDAGLRDAPAAEPDWAALFTEAGLDPAGFRPAASQWNPPQVYDARAAWEGHYAGRPDLPLRVEAAAYRGRPVYFETVGPWHEPKRQTPPGGSEEAKLQWVILMVVYFGALALGALLAWRNLRLGRGDRRGALRIAFFMFAIRVVYWVFAAHHVPTVGEVAGGFVNGLQSALFAACFVGVMYLALEPFLRRRWPEWLISWSRLLAGNFRDPLVGRDLLIGAACSAAIMVSGSVGSLLPVLSGRPPGVPLGGSELIYEFGLLGLNGFVPLLINQTFAALMFPLIIAAVVLFFVMLLRRRWLGVAVAWLVVCAPLVVAVFDKTPLTLLVALVMPTVIVVVLTRFGLLALIWTLFFDHLWVFFPVTTEFSAWYASGFVIQLFMLSALALYGFRTSLAGQHLFRGKFLEE
jgi:serine/threonine-protein kinase